MDTTTAAVWIFGIAVGGAVVVYVIKLVIRETGELEARGRAGGNEFLLKAKGRRK